MSLKKKGSVMSLAIDPAQNIRKNRLSEPSVAPSAEVWDLGGFSRGTCLSPTVRTLPAHTRTNGLNLSTSRAAGSRRSRAFELHREKRESLILGGFFTAALLIGAAFGGMFTETGAELNQEVAYAGTAIGAEPAATR